ncbi:response regulator [Marinobacter fuscus]|uniref:Response regulator n=1 Tax=Marinobacter fuscus TaxID=2109942 RepID=A0A2T1KTI4_9GAMM|nr:response regulator [Marinobacter fuscus]PSF13385.1 response regulator [Marinobacter fuscus]
MSAQILLVEDDPASLELFSYLLEYQGFQVYQAEDGCQALDKALALSSVLDLVISDIQMPEMDGYQLLKALRAHSDFATKPIIAITAFSMSGDEQRILGAGFDGYISKPIAPERFVAQVSQWLTPS